MKQNSDLTNDIGRFADCFLEEHFGESPDSLHVFNKPPFTLIHLQGFLMPSEKILMQKKNAAHILEIRDLLIHSIEQTLPWNWSRLPANKH